MKSEKIIKTVVSEKLKSSEKLLRFTISEDKIEGDFDLFKKELENYKIGLDKIDEVDTINIEDGGCAEIEVVCKDDDIKDERKILDMILDWGNIEKSIHVDSRDYFDKPPYFKKEFELQIQKHKQTGDKHYFLICYD